MPFRPAVVAILSTLGDITLALPSFLTLRQLQKETLRIACYLDSI